MKFIDQAKRGQGNWGTYVLTIAIVFMAMIIGQLFAEGISHSVLHHSLAAIPSDTNHNTVLILLLMPFISALVAIVLCVRYLHRQPMLTLFTTRETIDWRRILLSAGVWGTIMTIFLLIDLYSGNTLRWNLNWRQFIPLMLISLFVIPFQTTMEEVLFRGYLLQGFGKRFKAGIIPIILTGTMFGLLHGANPEVLTLGVWILVFYITSGIFLGILTHMDDGLELAIGYHAVNNIFAALIVTNNWQAFQTDALFVDTAEPTFGWANWLTIIVLQPLLLLLYSKIFKWKNWKEKMLG